MHIFTIIKSNQMNRIQLHLLHEQQRETPNVYVIKHLEKAIADGVITFSEWRSFKLSLSREELMRDDSEQKLHNDCEEIILYTGGYFIQRLSSNVFYINDDIPLIDSVDIAEQELWDLCSEELYK